LNFTVVLNAAAMKGKWAKATGETFKDTVIRVTGTVSEYRGSPQIQVDDEKHIQVIGTPD
jgi:DNA/RNA endonuclease YhcR with UshA esterase domain